MTSSMKEAAYPPSFCDSDEAESQKHYRDSGGGNSRSNLNALESFFQSGDSTYLQEFYSSLRLEKQKSCKRLKLAQDYDLGRIKETFILLGTTGLLPRKVVTYLLQKHNLGGM